MNESAPMSILNEEEKKQDTNPNTVTEQQTSPKFLAVSYTPAFSATQNLLKNNLDAVLFAKYLYIHNFVGEEPSITSNLLLNHRVNFCACLRSDVNKNSRMHQMYTTNLFPGETYCTHSLSPDFVKSALPPCCEGCTRAGTSHLEICPYYLSHLIVKTAHENDIDPEKLFERILGTNDKKFDTTAYYLPENFELEYDTRIDSQTACAAYLMLTSQLVQAQTTTTDSITYQYLALDAVDKRDNCMIDMVNFWKNTGRATGQLQFVQNVARFTSPSSEFRLRPHEVAAYMLWLSHRYNISAIDIAYHIATHQTYENVPLRDDYQINKWLQEITRLAIKEESKNELRDIIHYVISRKLNQRVPLLPINLTIATPDLDKADEIVSILNNAVWHCDYFQNNKSISQHNISCAATPLDEIIKLYSQIVPGTIMVLKDIAALYEQNTDSDTTILKQKRRHLFKLIESTKTSAITIFIGTEQEISELKASYNKLQNIVHRHIHMTEINSDEAYRLIMQQLSNYMEVTEEVAKNLHHYVQLSYAQAAQRDTAYVNETVESIIFNHYKKNVHAETVLSPADIPYITPPRTEQDILQTLNNFIGLDNVKQEVYNIAQMVKWNIKAGKRHLNAMNMHMVFSGNAGTGKTSVAYLMAEMLHSLGFIRENKLVVCSAKDLIGEYRGQTAPKTAKMCEAAYNGVLFIDEAYQLNPCGDTGSYAEECVVELIQQMENNRHRLIVIFAGYPQEMKSFIQQANPGLKSRIAKTLTFDDYTTEELVQIFEKIVQQNGLLLDDKARERVFEICTTAKMMQHNFGNARFVRNLFETSFVQHAVAMSDVDANDSRFMILQKDCIVAPND